MSESSHFLLFFNGPDVYPSEQGADLCKRFDTCHGSAEQEDHFENPKCTKLVANPAATLDSIAAISIGVQPKLDLDGLAASYEPRNDVNGTIDANVDALELAKYHQSSTTSSDVRDKVLKNSIFLIT